MAESIIKCEGLNKWYGSIQALKDVSIDIKKGESVGLVGDNGAGKSTFIKILSGVHKADTGKIFFDGNLVKINNAKDSMKLGIETIFQDSALAPTLSIARNLFVGREPLTFKLGSFGLLDRKKMAKESIDAIKRVELDLRSGDEVVENLSGGERQGVVIARALYFRTKVLIMDEPTNHLSVKETEKVLRWIEKLKAEGTTCIFITHNLHHVYPVSDRLVVFARGEKIADVQKKDTSIEDLTKMIVND
ncbi:MAG: ABC transporter ATP-binding protein [Candidatus Pelagibacter sp. TMED275]|jgi:simple sugar transport system ATP-binding protein|nr:MAG: ABC transporter ATP-binding protein [Candidatus Pelagibacter sp. TMED275]|tara:strand:- start:540 stop:1280 length:741 start_codon:yes stop_codon:yes gene_type:complete